MIQILKKKPDEWHKPTSQQEINACHRLWKLETVRREARGQRKAFHYKLRPTQEAF